MKFNLNNNLVKFLIVAVVLVIVVGIVFVLSMFGSPIQDKNTYLLQIANGKNITFEKLCSGNLNDITFLGSYETRRKVYVINNQNDLNKISGCGDVDFNQFTVVGASLGYSNTGGGGQRYVHISNVVETNDKIFIVLDIWKPSPNSGVTQLAGNSYSLYKIPKTNKQIIFVE